MTSEIIVVGSCNVDLVCFAPRMPLSGETLKGNKFLIANGGKGANQALMASKLGGKVAMLARVGDDDFGSNYLNILQSSNMNTSNILVTKGVATGTATIIVSQSTGDNCIVLTPGANGLLTVEDTEKNLPNMVKSSKVVIIQLEVEFEVSLNTLRHAKRHNNVTIFNTAPAYEKLDPEFYKLTDILCCNETEAMILTGMVCDVEDETSVRAVLKKLLEFGCKSVVFTVGKNGCLAIIGSDPENLIYAKPNKELLSNDIVDTTGAGDAFIGTMAFCLSQRIKTGKESLQELLTKEVLDTSVNVASLTVQKLGAQSSYPTREEINPKFLKF